MHCSVNLINRLRSTNNINSKWHIQISAPPIYTQGLQMSYSREQNLSLEITCNVFCYLLK